MLMAFLGTREEKINKIPCSIRKPHVRDYDLVDLTETVNGFSNRSG